MINELGSCESYKNLMTFEPLYMTIAKDIINSIQTGVYKEGNKLPSERTLSNRYFVSRFTIRSAINYLEELDFVYSLHGNGTFVKPQIIQVNLESMYDIFSVLQEQNIDCSTLVVKASLSPPPLILKSQMKLEDYEHLHEVVMLYSVNETPIFMQTHYITHTYCPRIDLSNLENQSVEKYCINKFSLNVERVEEALSSVIPEKSVQELLNLNQYNQYLMTTRTVYHDDRPIIITRTTMRGDKFSFIRNY